MKMLAAAALLIGSVFCVCRGANIIVIPTNIHSHHLYMSQLAADLTTYAHRVSILLPSNAKPPEMLRGTKVNVMTFQSPGKTSAMNSEEFSRHLIALAFSKSFVGTISTMREMATMGDKQMETDCEGRFQLIPQIKAQAFDFAIVDGQDLFCTPLLPYALEIPFALVSISIAPLQFRVPALPSFTPAFMSSLSDRMHFWQRTINTVQSLLMMAAYNLQLNGVHFAEKFAPERPPISPSGLARKASLLFLMNDLAIGYPFPLMPNVVPMADIMARPAKALPEDIQLFLDGASDGAILMSLGSVVNHVPDDVIDVFCRAFGQIEQKVLWKLPGNKDCRGMSPPNIMTSSWLPQNDILAHQNLKLFITHGGLNSVIESIYHAVPMVAIPVALDQPGNAARLSDKHLGVRMSIAEDFTTEKLVSNIREVMSNGSYKHAMHHACRVLRDRQESPGKRVSYWVDHVMQLGDAHLRTGAFDLNICQFLMFDVLAFLAVAVLVCAGCLVKVGCCVGKRCCCPPARQRKKSKVE
ncbi:hypothetical protein CAPTEDRAFT_152728 [Capitella teleta]|uniref:UDP-glucuronosyltransferase n=1 Tax=Capitella teleta TaxID=283909 RepID=R7V524_CAPTE|nr:hypothetical protein CAPTEDRAFT_152728 [Capitella teleta]|eukprot:ELU11456.1 hypothetical protein CAPTEDRAFT_152728 [Capitella teleta]